MHCKTNFDSGVSPGGEHDRAQARPGTGNFGEKLREEVRVGAQRQEHQEDEQVRVGGGEPGVQVGNQLPARHQDGRGGGGEGVGGRGEGLRLPWQRVQRSVRPLHTGGVGRNRDCWLRRLVKLLFIVCYNFYLA